MVDRYADLGICDIIGDIMFFAAGHPVAVHEWEMVCPAMLHEYRW